MAPFLRSALPWPAAVLLGGPRAAGEVDGASGALVAAGPGPRARRVVSLAPMPCVLARLRLWLAMPVRDAVAEACGRACAGATVQLHASVFDEELEEDVDAPAIVYRVEKLERPPRRSCRDMQHESAR